MEIQGQLVEVFPLKKGTSQKTGNEWQMQDFLISVKSGEYENKVLLQAKECNYPIGSQLKCQLDIKAREYNGRWYNTIGAWKIESNTQPIQQKAVEAGPMDATPDDSNLPF